MAKESEGAVREHAMWWQRSKGGSSKGLMYTPCIQAGPKLHQGLVDQTAEPPPSDLSGALVVLGERETL